MVTYFKVIIEGLKAMNYVSLYHLIIDKRVCLYILIVTYIV